MSRPRLFARRAIAVAAAGALLTLVAFVFDAAPLFVSGVALLAVGLTTPVWVWTTARGARVERRIERTRVVEEQPVTASIVVRRGWFGLGGWARLDHDSSTEHCQAGTRCTTAPRDSHPLDRKSER